MKPRPTLQDVAELAGVSMKTVSRVVNNERYVSEATRTQVREAMERLAFRAEPSQRPARLGGAEGANLIAHFYGDPGGLYTNEIHLGMLARCHALGYNLVIDQLDYQSPETADRTRALLRRLRPSGVVLSAPLTDNDVILGVLEEAGVPYVPITPLTERPTIPSVRIDERRAAYQLTQHLIAYGHRRIGFIRGLHNHAGTHLRFAGFEQALSEAGLEIDPSLVVDGEFLYFVTLPFAERMLSRPDRPTAIFASNDEMAAAVIKVAHEMEMKLPDDLSVVGFDDIPAAEMLWPSLTTVRQPVSNLGAAAADLLFARLNRPREEWPNPAPHQVLQYDIVLRSSVATAPELGAGRGRSGRGRAAD